jgi:Ca2+-binding EF-hand superfamily protein|tara:strand:+ start:2249 stop:2584 length:336 start_codon:yes stop_codon:yes gene_type:complete
LVSFLATLTDFFTSIQTTITSLLHEFAQVFFSKGRENYARKAFLNFDVDNSGKVDRYEFACALKGGIGVKVNDDDIVLLEDAFYGDDIEEIKYQDFIDFVRGHYMKAHAHE